MNRYLWIINKKLPKFAWYPEEGGYRSACMPLEGYELVTIPDQDFKWQGWVYREGQKVNYWGKYKTLTRLRSDMRRWLLEKV